MGKLTKVGKSLLKKSLNEYHSSEEEKVIDDTFPFDAGDEIWGSPAAADLDGDGITDFVVTSKSKHLYIFDKKTPSDLIILVTQKRKR